MTEDTGKGPLEGDNAIALWLLGKDKWNKCVEENPEARVDFSGKDFSKYRNKVPYGMISFEDFKFPNGGVSFMNAIFGDDGVSFYKTRFGDGDVDFRGAKFGDGGVSFRRAIFGDGKVDFYSTRFINCVVRFDNAKFGDGEVNFYNVNFPHIASFEETEFGDGGVSFEGTTFNCHAEFSDVIFGKGDANFLVAKFNDSVDFRGAKFSGKANFNCAKFWGKKVSFCNVRFGDVDFREATFGGCDVFFNDAKFGNGDVFFNDAKFGDSNVSFNSAEFEGSDVFFGNSTFGNSIVDFSYAKCGGQFYFSPRISIQITLLSFYACTFKGVMILKGTYNCVPDLRNTITSSHVDLSGLKVDEGYKKLVVQKINGDVGPITNEWVGQLNDIFDDPLNIESAEKITRIKTEIKAAFPEKKWETSIKQWNEKLEISLKKDPKTLLLPKKLINKYKEKVKTGYIKEVVAQFCRLKELAEQNRAHDRALDFFADECRMNRNWEFFSWMSRVLSWLPRVPSWMRGLLLKLNDFFRSLLDGVYALTCRHGRSIGRPVLGLVLSWVFFSWVYSSVLPWLRPVICSEYSYVHGYEYPKFSDAFLLNIFNSVPFLGFTRYRYEKIFEGVFGLNPSLWDYMTIGLQSLTAFIFLFLIGLGIRNRFRI